MAQWLPTNVFNYPNFLMIRRKSRTDTNQSEIVAALRQHGASVQCLHTIGKGVPDLLVGLQGRNYLLELKDGNKPPSARRLTADETKWHSEWRTQIQLGADR